MREEFKDQVALVTGASRGIGLATAKLLAEDGASVAVLARDKGRADRGASQLPHERGRGYVCDVGDVQSVNDTIKRVEEELGPISILVNNAGLVRDQLLFRIRDKDWEELLNVNLKGAFNTMRAVSRGMAKRRYGSIVNVSSVVAFTGNAGQSAYVAAKAGLIGLTKSIARELGPRGVRANVVAPGYIETQMTADLTDEIREKMLAQISMGRLGKPEEVASVIHFLVGSGARYVNGQTIIVDGGMVM